MQSIWTETERLLLAKPLEGDTKTDVLIVGGGLCGVLCAYLLQREGVDCLLVEKDRIGRGVTGHTTAKITSQHGLIYHKLIQSIGRERAAIYFNANQKAVQQYRKLAQNIACDFEEKRAGVYARDNRRELDRELRALDSLGIRAEYTSQLPLPFEIKGAVLFPHQAQFHPLKLLEGLAESLNLRENTFVRRVNGHIAYTNRGMIRADHIIIATHFPFLNRRGSYFLKLYQQRSYVLALKNAPDVGGMYIDAVQNGLSFRNYGELLLLGGGGHRTGKRGGNWQQLGRFAEKKLPNSKEVCRWATQDCMSLDGIPYIGRYSKNTPNLYVATGFNKWGMTSSMVAATLLRDMVLERRNAWTEVFSPSRSILKPQLCINGLEAAGNLLMPTPRRCPHMGCALRWNPRERVWDCPCHGSRFAQNGKLLDGPAIRNAKTESR